MPDLDAEVKALQALVKEIFEEAGEDPPELDEEKIRKALKEANENPDSAAE